MKSEDDDKDTIETKQAIKEAQAQYNKLLEDKHEMELAELREKYMLEQISLKRTGYREGKEAALFLAR